MGLLRLRVPLDAIVVLGCRTGPDDRPTATARRRAARAASAWHEGVAPVIIVSGGRRWHGRTEAEALRQLLLGRKIPNRAIILEQRSLSTRGNAAEVAPLLRARGAKHVGLVTCDWHMPRALSTFRRLSLRVTALPAASPPAGRIRTLLRSGREQVSRILSRVALGGP